MTDEARRAHAKALFANALTHEILDKLESDAVNQAVAAKPVDDEARRAHLGQVTAIRALRTKLKNLSTVREGDDE